MLTIMKKRVIALFVLVCMLVLSSCEAPSYIENQFYSAETLEEGLVPDLPKPTGEYLYRTGTSSYCDKIYIFSEETIDEYFNRILDYIQEDEYKIVGWADYDSEYPTKRVNEDNLRKVLFAVRKEIMDNNLILDKISGSEQDAEISASADALIESIYTSIKGFEKDGEWIEL